MNDAQKIRSQLRSIKIEFVKRFSLLDDFRCDELKGDLPEGWIPILIEHHENFDDIYAYSGSENGVKVWSEHAFVMGWGSIDEFMDWLRIQIVSNGVDSTKSETGADT